MSLVMFTIGLILAAGDGISRSIRDIGYRNDAIKKGKIYWSDSFGREYLISNGHRCYTDIRDGDKVLIDDKNERIVYNYSEAKRKAEENEYDQNKKMSKEKGIESRRIAEINGDYYYTDYYSTRYNEFTIQRRTSDNIVGIIKNNGLTDDIQNEYISAFDPEKGSKVCVYYFSKYIKNKTVDKKNMDFFYDKYVHDINNNRYNYEYEESFVKKFIEDNNIEIIPLSYEDYKKKYAYLFND